MEVTLAYHSTKLFKMKNSVACSTFMMLCNHPLSLAPDHFRCPQRKPHIHVAATLVHPSPHPTARAGLFPVSTDLPRLDISYQRDPTVCRILHLASHSASCSQGSSSCSRCQWPLPFSWPYSIPSVGTDHRLCVHSSCQ